MGDDRPDPRGLTCGFALQERTITGDVPAELERRSEAVAGTRPYPYLMEIAAEFARTGYDYAREFEFGLDLTLTALTASLVSRSLR